MRTKVEELLQRKGSTVVTIDAEASVREATARMVGEGVGSLVVTSEGRIAGIFTERDCVRRVVLEGRSPASTSVAQAMTGGPVQVSPDHTVEQCMALMTKQRCRHLLVLRYGRVVGLISIGDCTAHLSRAAVEENGMLLEYITGRYPG